MEVAIDGFAERFGMNVVHRANDLNKPAGMRLAPTLDFLDDRTLDSFLANVRFGSLADITACLHHVRFTLDCVAKLTDGAR